MNGPPMPALGVVISGPHYHQYGGGGMPPTAMISPAGVIDLAGEDFEPQPRDRCNTWPLQKPSGDLSHHTSPLIHEEIPEEELCDEEEDAGSADNLSDSVPFCGTANRNHLNGGGGDVTGGAFSAVDMLLEDLSSGAYDNSSIEDNGFSSGSVAGNSAANAGGSKKNSARRNAWGNLSYADLITQAILHSNEKRLTLSQIYDWMVQNVPYFRDKGDSNSSAGWKNSIRHNLSLHSRFMRIQNEGAGKSSWWIINPEAKPGKSSRRRAGSMEQGAKNLDKKRGRVKKKLDQLRASTGHLVAGDGSVGELLLSPEPSSAEIVYDGVGGASTAAQQPPATGFSVFGLSPGEFRQRSDSNLSNYSVSSQRGGTTAKLASPLLDDNGGAYDDWAAQAPSGCLGNDYPEDLESMTLNDQQYQLVRDNANNVVMCPQPPSYSTYLAESQQQSTGVAAVNSQQFNNSQQLLGQRQTSPVDVSPRRLMTIGGGGGSGSTTPVKSPQRYSPAAAGGCLNVKKEPPTFSLSSNNPVAELLGSGFAPQQMKTEPPAYQELYPQGRSSLAASNPMLRDVLQKSIGAPPLLGHNFNQHQQDGSFRQSRSDSNFANLIAQQQQQPHPPIDYFGSGNFYPQQHHAAAAFRPANHHHGNNHHNHHNFQQHNHHHHHTLPTELSDIRYDNHFTSDIQCDIDQVIRHELNVAGKLDFGDFGNIQ